MHRVEVVHPAGVRVVGGDDDLVLAGVEVDVAGAPLEEAALGFAGDAHDAVGPHGFAADRDVERVLAAGLLRVVEAGGAGKDQGVLAGVLNGKGLPDRAAAGDEGELLPRAVQRRDKALALAAVRPGGVYERVARGELDAVAGVDGEAVAEGGVGKTLAASADTLGLAAKAALADGLAAEHDAAVDRQAGAALEFNVRAADLAGFHGRHDEVRLAGQQPVDADAAGVAGGPRVVLGGQEQLIARRRLAEVEAAVLAAREAVALAVHEVHEAPPRLAALHVAAELVSEQVAVADGELVADAAVLLERERRAACGNLAGEVPLDLVVDNAAVALERPTRPARPELGFAAWHVGRFKVAVLQVQVVADDEVVARAVVDRRPRGEENLARRHRVLHVCRVVEPVVHELHQPVLEPPLVLPEDHRPHDFRQRLVAPHLPHDEAHARRPVRVQPHQAVVVRVLDAAVVVEDVVDFAPFPANFLIILIPPARLDGRPAHLVAVLEVQPQIRVQRRPDGVLGRLGVRVHAVAAVLRKQREVAHELFVNRPAVVEMKVAADLVGHDDQLLVAVVAAPDLAVHLRVRRPRALVPLDNVVDARRLHPPAEDW